MRSETIVAGAAMLCAAAITTSTGADFLSVDGLVVDETDCSTTFRIYAHFSDPEDRLFAVGSDVSGDPIRFTANVPLFNDGRPFAGLKQEDFASAPFSGPLDSWVTIGADELVGNDTDYTPGFAGSDGVSSVITGMQFSESNGAWWDSDPLTRVTGTELLIAQFTFPRSFTSFELSGYIHWEPPGSDLVYDWFEVIAIVESPCPWDLDGDQSVGFLDLLLMLSTWGHCSGCCAADLDGSGEIDFLDLVELLSFWDWNC